MLIVLRHGRTAWNAQELFQGWAEEGLDETGFEQAHQGAVALAAVVAGPVQLVASDLRRTVQTAQAVADVLGTTFSTDPALREVDCGGWTGLSEAEVADRFPDEFLAWQRGEDIRRGGGETYHESGARVADAITRWMTGREAETLVVVGHGKSLQWGLDILAERACIHLTEPAPHLGNAEFLVLPNWRHDQNDSALSER
ncbi:MAG TPA: histidine phosphatase family protein [Acidimicrobiales bacterium]|jgi:probable phosphoglycerate mutase|nr:histidine phosphatase family protein [Acidimicrobiales bacterium]